MTSTYSIQIDLPSESFAPEPWDHGDGVRLRLDHVISKDAKGEPLSKVGDMVWNWTYYTARKVPSFLSFYFWKTGGNRSVTDDDITPQRLSLIREMQYLMILRIYHSEHALSYLTLYGELISLRKFARFATSKKTSIRSVLEDGELLNSYISTVPDCQCLNVIRWLNFLRNQVSLDQLGFAIATPKRQSDLKRRAQEYTKNQTQTVPLPTGIYLKLIVALSAELDDIEKHKDQLLTAIRTGLHMHKSYKAKGWKMGASFGPELVAEYGLGAFLAGKGLDADLNGLTSVITNVQRLCKLQIHVFSGMRDEEAEHLPFHCMETVEAGHGRCHHLLVGATTKLAGGRFRRTRWVTTDAEGFRAVRLAQAFASVIYESLDVVPATTEKTKDHYALFASTSYLPWVASVQNLLDARYMPSRKLWLADLSAVLKSALCPCIQLTDIAELQAIDEFKDWTIDPEFALGQPWPLKTHQLRRSLALYANASGLVRTSSLKRQLQHITREMTDYYGRGAEFAKNFLNDDAEGFRKHICFEWQDTEEEAQYLAFAREVINSDEPLYGPGGIFYELKKVRNEVMRPEEIKDLIRMGRMSYKDTPLGGCSHVGICEKQKGLRFTSGICVSENCRSLIGKHSRVIKLIPLQRKIVDNLIPGTVVFDMEKEELDILVDAEVKWRSPRGKSLASLE